MINYEDCEYVKKVFILKSARNLEVHQMIMILREVFFAKVLLIYFHQRKCGAESFSPLNFIYAMRAVQNENSPTEVKIHRKIFTHKMKILPE